MNDRRSFEQMLACYCAPVLKKHKAANMFHMDKAKNLSIFALIREPDDVTRYALVIVFTDLLNNLASFFYIKRQIPISLRDIEIKPHIAPLISMLVISNVNILYTQLDKMLLDQTVGSLAVTIYKIPQDITYMISNLLSSVVMVAEADTAKHRRPEAPQLAEVFSPAGSPVQSDGRWNAVLSMQRPVIPKAAASGIPCISLPCRKAEISPTG